MTYPVYGHTKNRGVLQPEPGAIHVSEDGSARKIPAAESFDHIRERLEQIKREENRDGDKPQPDKHYYGWGFPK